ncbi:MAG: YigZ family protein [Bacilli bacterium]|nr:YigZ family protein [Bacilli bacterium]
MKLLNKSKIEIKKSKFLGYAYEVETIEEVKQVIDTLKKEHNKAKHAPYAYILSNTAGKSDDKEPSNTAGLPIYNLLEMRNLKNIIVVVVRYFGGTKLGAGNLLRAYLEAAKEAIKDL